MHFRQLIIVGVLMQLAYLSFYFVDESPNEVLVFICVNAVAFGLLAFLVWRFRIPNAQPGNQHLLVILGCAIAFRLTLVLHSPVASDDIYRYVWDGKVASSGINPFALAPTDSSLMHLHTDVIPSRINFPSMRTIYPPLAQVLFYTSHKLFGDSISGLKVLLVLADMISILLLAQLHKLYQLKNHHTLILYAWSPLPIMYFGLDGHIDALGIPFLLLFLFVLKKNRHVASAVALGAAVLAKLYPMFIAPFLFHAGRGWKRFVLPLIPAAMFAIGCVFYWEPTGGLVESFKVFNSEFEFNGSVFHIVYKFVETNKQAHLVSSMLFVVWLAALFFLNRPMLEKTFLAFLGFIIFAPVVQPWYLTWLAALLVLRWSSAVFVLLGLSNLSNIVVYQYRLNGVWEDSTLILLLEYLPFFCLLVLEIVKGKFSSVSAYSSLHNT